MEKKDVAGFIPCTEKSKQPLKTTIFNHFVRNSKVKTIHLEDMVKIL